MSECANCSGNCSSCGSCDGSLLLNSGELQILRKLGQIPFLPVARYADSAEPIYLEDQDFTPKEYSMILQSLEKKGLISLDFDIPLKGFHSEAYSSYPIVGSFALSARGQHVLQLLELQGIQ